MKKRLFPILIGSIVSLNVSANFVAVIKCDTTITFKENNTVCIGKDQRPIITIPDNPDPNGINVSTPKVYESCDDLTEEDVTSLNNYFDNEDSGIKGKSKKDWCETTSIKTPSMVGTFPKTALSNLTNLNHLYYAKSGFGELFDFDDFGERDNMRPPMLRPPISEYTTEVSSFSNVMTYSSGNTYKWGDDLKIEEIEDLSQIKSIMWRFDKNLSSTIDLSRLTKLKEFYYHNPNRSNSFTNEQVLKTSEDKYYILTLSTIPSFANNTLVGPRIIIDDNFENFTEEEKNKVLLNNTLLINESYEEGYITKEININTWFNIDQKVDNYNNEVSLDLKKITLEADTLYILLSKDFSNQRVNFVTEEDMTYFFNSGVSWDIPNMNHYEIMTLAEETKVQNVPVEHKKVLFASDMPGEYFFTSNLIIPKETKEYYVVSDRSIQNKEFMIVKPTEYFQDSPYNMETQEVFQEFIAKFYDEIYPNKHLFEPLEAGKLKNNEWNKLYLDDYAYATIKFSLEGEAGKNYFLTNDPKNISKTFQVLPDNSLVPFDENINNFTYTFKEIEGEENFIMKTIINDTVYFGQFEIPSVSLSSKEMTLFYEALENGDLKPEIEFEEEKADFGVTNSFVNIELKDDSIDFDLKLNKYKKYLLINGGENYARQKIKKVSQLNDGIKEVESGEFVINKYRKDWKNTFNYNIVQGEIDNIKYELVKSWSSLPENMVYGVFELPEDFVYESNKSIKPYIESLYENNFFNNSKTANLDTLVSAYDSDVKNEVFEIKKRKYYVYVNYNKDLKYSDYYHFFFDEEGFELGAVDPDSKEKLAYTLNGVANYRDNSKELIIPAEEGAVNNKAYYSILKPLRDGRLGARHSSTPILAQSSVHGLYEFNVKPTEQDIISKVFIGDYTEPEVYNFTDNQIEYLNLLEIHSGDLNEVNNLVDFQNINFDFSYSEYEQNDFPNSFDTNSLSSVDLCGNNINNLLMLSGVEKIDNYLDFCSTNITSLEGLNDLKIVEELYIDDLPHLTDISALSNLEEGYIGIYGLEVTQFTKKPKLNSPFCIALSNEDIYAEDDNDDLTTEDLCE